MTCFIICQKIDYENNHTLPVQRDHTWLLHPTTFCFQIHFVSFLVLLHATRKNQETDNSQVFIIWFAQIVSICPNCIINICPNAQNVMYSRFFMRVFFFFKLYWPGLPYMFKWREYKQDYFRTILWSWNIAVPECLEKSLLSQLFSGTYYKHFKSEQRIKWMLAIIIASPIPHRSTT